MVLMTLGNSNTNAVITEDNTSPTLLGIRGGHGDVPILVLDIRESSDGQPDQDCGYVPNCDEQVCQMPNRLHTGADKE